MSERIVNIWVEEIASAYPEIVRCRDCKHFTPKGRTDLRMEKQTLTIAHTYAALYCR